MLFISSFDGPYCKRIIYIYISIIVEIDFNMTGKCNKKACNRCVPSFLFRMNGK